MLNCRMSVSIVEDVSVMNAFFELCMLGEAVVGIVRLAKAESPACRETLVDGLNVSMAERFAPKDCPTEVVKVKVSFINAPLPL